MINTKYKIENHVHLIKKQEFAKTIAPQVNSEQTFERVNLQEEGSSRKLTSTSQKKIRSYLAQEIE